MDRRERDDKANVNGYRHDRRRHARGLLALREMSASHADARDGHRFTSGVPGYLTAEK
jgi:hypothetical protein